MGLKKVHNPLNYMQKLNTKYSHMISMVSAMGGLLFGYDWVVVGGGAKYLNNELITNIE